ncbi:TonB-dependent receptor [Novosphingobium sp.]|uniref:TonB-dependent receptor n=1 Tax=Novosphingobium sp. TaxID=1874826 RepID=UPI0038B6E3E6
MTDFATPAFRARTTLKAAALAATILAAAPAFAEEAEATKADDNGIEQITVTARKRVEDVQSVPLAVSAIGGKALEARFVPDVRAVAKYIPNVQLGQVQYSGATLSASIRGISFADIERSFEPAVATSIDGIFLASNTGALVDMFDVESIEVLRGPQGTLFGRNTVGGIINVKRSRPTGELGAKLSATVGSYGRNDYKAIFNAPIIKDVLAAKIGVFSINSDSFTYDARSRKAEPGLDRLDITGSLLFTPTANFEALLTYEHLRDRSHYPNPVNQSVGEQKDASGNVTYGGELACTAFGLCGHAADYEKSGYRASYGGLPFSAPLDADNVTLNMKYKADNFSIVSVTGYMKNKDSLNIDNIGDALNVSADPENPAYVPLFHPVRKLHGDQFSQELRIDTDFDGMFNMVAGVYYFQSTYSLDNQSVYVADATENPGARVDTFSAGQTVKSYAAFAETYWKVTPTTRITVGGRYTHETKDFHVEKPAVTLPEGGPYKCPDVNSAYAPCRNPHLAFNRFTPRVSVDQELAKDIMTYVSWSRGFRSGGWNGRPGSTPDSIGPYQPETVDSYEVGFRSKFWDNKAIFNLTLFQTEYKNKQEDQIRSNPVLPTSTITFVENAGKARFQGVELETQVRPVPELHFFASAGYLKAKYLQFIDGTGKDVSASKQLRYAPKWNASVGGDYTFDLAGGDQIVFGTNLKYVDKYATESSVDPAGLGREIIPSHTAVDASLTYTGHLASLKEYKISAFVNDAFHSGGRIVRSSYAGPFWFSDRIPNRTWGIEAQVEF